MYTHIKLLDRFITDLSLCFSSQKSCLTYKRSNLVDAGLFNYSHHLLKGNSFFYMGLLNNEGAFHSLLQCSRVVSFYKNLVTWLIFLENSPTIFTTIVIVKYCLLLLSNEVKIGYIQNW